MKGLKALMINKILYWLLNMNRTSALVMFFTPILCAGILLAALHHPLWKALGILILCFPTFTFIYASVLMDEKEKKNGSNHKDE